MLECAAYLQENGMPTQCVLELISTCAMALLVPISLWSTYGLLRRPNKHAPHKLRLLGFLSGVVALCFQRQVIMPFFAVMLFEEWLQLQKSQICGGTLLFLYVVQAILGAAGFKPAYGCLFSGIAFVCEFFGSNTAPLGYDNATIFGKLTISYVSHMLQVARKGQLTHEDFAEIPSNMSTEQSFDLLAAHLDRTNKHCLKAVLAFNKWRIIVMIVLNTIGTLINYLRPLLLATFLSNLAKYQRGEQNVYPSLYVGSLIGAVQLSIPALNSAISILNTLIGSQTRAALMETIYRKASRLSNDSKITYDSAKIMNLLNVDTAIIQNCYQYFPTLIEAPMGVIVCTWQLYHFIGRASFAAIPIYLLFIPYSSWHTKRMFKRFPELMKVKDIRTKSLWGIFRNIKSLKLYAWEEPYQAQVVEHRDAEIQVQRKYLKLISIMRSLSIMIDDVVAAAVFIAYLYYSGAALTPEIVFPTLSLLSFLSDPFTSLPSAISGMGRTLTSQDRINTFLDQPEHISHNYYRDNGHDGTVVIENAAINWSKSSPQSVIEHLSVVLGKGDLCCVVGRVGSGKTALLKALCDQMYIKDGSVSISGSIAYCPQEPWLQFKSIRENILFGLEFDEEFYQKTIQYCQLEPDLKNLPQGDMTQVGEKGICLSGGQKARVAIARAVYSRSDIYLFDDVLSAVDEHVSRNLVSSLFCPTGLLAQRTVVLSTNSKPVLKHASLIVTVYKGGKYSLSAPEDDADTVRIDSVAPSREPSHEPPMLSSDSGTLRPAREQFASTRMAALAHIDTPEPVFDNSRIEHADLEDEEQDQRANVFQVFGRYFKSVGMRNVVITAIFFCASVFLPNLILVWLTVWSDKHVKGLAAAKFYVLVYIGLSVLSGASVFLSVYWFYGRIGNTASFNLHAAMVTSVLQSPLSFFDKTPMGVIMNRFTGDISTLDQTVPNTVYNFCRTLLMVSANFLITIFGAPFLVVVIIPLMFVYNNFRKSYIPCSRQLQRIMSAARGPILSHIEESVKGIATIAAFGRWPQFISVYRARSDYWMEAVFLYTSLSRWLNWRIRLITVTITWCSAMSMILLVRIHPLFSIGLAGVVMHTTQRAAMLLSRVIRNAANIEVSAVAIERIFEFCDLETEAARVLPDDQPKWLEHGTVEFKDYSTRYRPDLPIVLKNINIEIKKCEKIGVVGRTGASKSTLCLSLFRILEATSGQIDIDSAQISRLGLCTLRSNLSIIPQDAQIFAGTLRQNLSPIGEFEDEKLWNVLELCHLKEHFSDFEKGLDTELLEGGENLSRGQAQLICLGRALLHESPIMVLDEATASVDTETDAIVQQTIRTEFKNRTIITIAHRLNTIMDCDRILVLGHGKVLEFDTPANLLEARGEFYALSQNPTEL